MAGRVSTRRQRCAPTRGQRKRAEARFLPLPVRAHLRAATRRSPSTAIAVEVAGQRTHDVVPCGAVARLAIVEVVGAVVAELAGMRVLPVRAQRGIIDRRCAVPSAGSCRPARGEADASGDGVTRASIAAAAASRDEASR
jgi:hypothetical protein